MKNREEAWSKIDSLAKQNPTFEQFADLLANCDQSFPLFLDSGQFSMIDDEDLLLAGDDLLPVTSDTKCDTQVGVVVVDHLTTQSDLSVLLVEGTILS